MSESIACWQCGQLLVDLIFPLSRREECQQCGADQHVCKLCQDYNPHVADACREDRAEAVTDKERANFCDYFSPKPNAFVGAGISEEAKARKQLAALFGDEVADAGSDEALDETAVSCASENSITEADAALSELEKLFGKD